MIKSALLVVFCLIIHQTHAQPEEVTLTTPPKGEIAIPISDEQFVEKYWGKEFGQCFMSQQQFDEFEKKWARYRVLTRARYNILAKSYFADKMPKQNPIEIDKNFQYQALEPSTCPGMTDEERFQGVQKALEASLAEESLTVADIKKFFELDEAPKRLEDYLDLFNDPAFISMPYSLQDGYDQLFKIEWNRLTSKKEADYTFSSSAGQSQNLKFKPEDLRAIDAIARTMWAELGACEKADQGHYQMFARLLADRASACQSDPLINRRHCRADPLGTKLPIFEQVVSAPAQFSCWGASSYANVEVTNAGGKKIGKTTGNQTGFRKLVKANPTFRKTLCPAAGEAAADLKKAYQVALEFYRDPKAFVEKWRWPKGVKSIRFYSYGINFSGASPKNVHAIIENTAPPKEWDLKKTASASCPAPNLYEKR